MQGQIIKIISDLHVVSCDGELYLCKCRGIFRKYHIVPLVGDYVIFHPEKKVIEKILPRKNEFCRPRVSNIDQAFLITSLIHPDFSLSLLDRLIVLMEIHHVSVVICITKEDLLTQEQLADVYQQLNYYRQLGYSVVSNQDLEKIKELIRGKTSVFTGQTGAGKSTLLNRLNPDWNLETGEVSLALGRGKHTTRVVSLFELYDGKVMDTPGFSALDFYGYSKDDIREAFIEFQQFPCPFKNCTHTKEEECSVKRAVFENHIMSSRYQNYLKFIGEEEK